MTMTRPYLPRMLATLSTVDSAARPLIVDRFQLMVLRGHLLDGSADRINAVEGVCLPDELARTFLTTRKSAEMSSGKERSAGYLIATTCGGVL